MSENAIGTPLYLGNCTDARLISSTVARTACRRTHGTYQRGSSSMLLPSSCLPRLLGGATPPDGDSLHSDYYNSNNFCACSGNSLRQPSSVVLKFAIIGKGRSLGTHLPPPSGNHL